MFSGDHVLKLGSKYGNIRAVMAPVKKEEGNISIDSGILLSYEENRNHEICN